MSCFRSCASAAALARSGQSSFLYLFSSVFICVPFSVPSLHVCSFHTQEAVNDRQKKLLNLDSKQLRSFLKTHCRKGFDNLGDAHVLFRHMLGMCPIPNVFDFTQLLSGVARMKEHSTVVYLFKNMLLLNNYVPSNGHTVGVAINCYCHLSLVDMGFSLLGRIIKNGYEIHDVTYATLLNGLCLGDRVPEAVGLFNKMVNWKDFIPNESMYGTITKGLCDMGNAKAAIRLLRVMENGNCKPNLVIYSTIIDGLCKDQMVNDALRLFHEMKEKAILPNLITYTSLIRGLYNSRRWKDVAFNLFKEMKVVGLSPDIVAYTTMVDGLCKNGRMDHALSYLVEMKDSGIEPNIVTYTCLMDALCKDGKLKVAMDLFSSLLARGLQVNVKTYNILIYGLCGHGLLSEAKDMFMIMEENGCEPDEIIFKTVILGFLKHNEVKEAAVLAEKMISRGFTQVANVLSMLVDVIPEEDAKDIITKINVHNG